MVSKLSKKKDVVSETIQNSKPSKIKVTRHKAIWPYTLLQLRLSFAKEKSNKRSKRILGWVGKIVVFAMALALLWLLSSNLTSQSSYITTKNLTIALFTIIEIVLLIYSVSLQSRRLNKPTDLRIILAMPLDNFQRYIGEILAIYLKLTIFSLIIFWPSLLIYGWAGRIMSVKFVFASLLADILLPLLPFSIALVICVPFMYLNNYLDNKFIIKLIIFVCIFIVGLVIYGFFLKFIIDQYNQAETSAKMMKQIGEALNAMNKPYNFCFFISETCLGNKIYFWVPALIGISAVFTTIGIFITKPVYQKFIDLDLANSNSGAKIKQSKITEKSPTLAIMHKELKNIIRNSSYAYFYLGVMVSMPVMTYMVTNLIKQLGQAQLGSQAFFGFAILVVFIIVSLVGSYSADVVSREGKQFYLTKTSPITFRRQLFAKLLINFIVAFVGLLLCIMVLAIMSGKTDTNDVGLSGLDIMFVFFISTFYLIGIIFNGANIDLVRPRIDMLGGVENDSNVVIQIIIALLIAAIASILSITVGSVNAQAIIWVQVGILSAMVAYSLINFLIWYFTCERKYQAIEIK